MLQYNINSSKTYTNNVLNWSICCLYEVFPLNATIIIISIIIIIIIIVDEDNRFTETFLGFSVYVLTKQRGWSVVF